MEVIAKYFVTSDRFLLIGAEKIYLHFFVDEIGELPREDQIEYLVANLAEPGTNFPYLCSIYYLLTEHSVGLHESGFKQLNFTIKPDLLSSLRALVVIDHCLDFLTVEVPKEEDMIHFRIKTVADLCVCLLSAHFGDLQYQAPNYPGLIQKAISLCFRCIKLSQDRTDVDLRRISAILLLFLMIKFRERLAEADLTTFEHLEDEEKIETFERMKKLLEKEENGCTAAVKELVKIGHFADIESWYTAMVIDPTNPLPTVLVVGYLRALLNLVTTARARSSNPSTAGFDCTSELESTYNYMSVYLSDIASAKDLYKTKVENKKKLAVTNFLFFSLALDKHETLPEISESFLELKILNAYKQIYSKDRDILPDSLSKELEELKSQPDATESTKLIGILTGEVYSHRITSIYFMTHTFRLVHSILKSNNFFQALSLGNYIYDAKGVLVMLKIISEKILQSEYPLHKNALEVIGIGAPPVETGNPIEGVVEDILYLFYNIAFDYPDIINGSLNEYKAHYALKKYPKLFPKNAVIGRLTYELIKKQMDLMPKKVKANTANMSIVSHNFNAHLDHEPKPQYIEGLDGPAKSVSEFSKAKSSNSFHTVTSANSVKQYLSSELKGVADLYLTNAKFESNHETSKKLCAAMNSVYLKHKDVLPELLNQKTQGQRPQNYSRMHLYNELYSKVKVPDNFELFYARWLDDEVFGLIE